MIFVTILVIFLVKFAKYSKPVWGGRQEALKVVYHGQKSFYLMQM